ncbi:MAG TPA: hypothetical protein VNH44_11395 [Micropepsaceae bacterium]|nr:hypothetical protein [Micropepsaceae bacterium]
MSTAVTGFLKIAEAFAHLANVGAGDKQTFQRYAGMTGLTLLRRSSFSRCSANLAILLTQVNDTVPRQCSNAASQ